MRIQVSRQIKSLKWLILIALFISPIALAQQPMDYLVTETENLGAGWDGFTDVDFLIDAFFTLLLATVLGAVFAYHPRYLQTADTLEELEAPRIHIFYSVIGSIIGILVIKYGLVVGFVLFGIGGLMRFRTSLGSASLTGRVIFVTLIGLSSGLDLPHVAVLVTIFGWVLVFILDARVTYKIVVKGLVADQVVRSAPAYKEQLEKYDCDILSEKKSPDRGRVIFIFRGPGNLKRSELERALDTDIDQSLRGTVDWQVD